MASEKLNFDTYDSGWEAGVIDDVDEAIAGADGAVISTATKNDVALMGCTASVVEDADTVTGIDVVVRARTTGSGADSLGVELLIGGIVQGSRVDIVLTASFQNLTFNDVAWDADRTAAEMDGIEIRLHARQSGMPTAAGHEVDCGDIDVAFDEGGNVEASGGATLAAAVAAGVAKKHVEAHSVSAGGFPTIASITESQVTEGAALVVDNPASGIVSGDLLLHIACCDGTGDTISYPAGDLTDNQLANLNVGVFGILITYEIADGSENGGSNTLTLSAGVENINAFVLHIQGWHGTTPPELARVNGDGSNPDPPNLDPVGWGTEETLWIAGQLQDQDANTVSVYPYPDNQRLTADAQSQIAFSSDELATAAQDPGAFTLSIGTDREAFTIAIRPAAGGDGPAIAPVIAAGTASTGVTSANGAAILAAAVAAGTATVRKNASGAATLAPSVAAGTAKKRIPASGAATLTPAIAAGTAQNVTPAFGAAILAVSVAAGVAQKVIKASGGAVLAPAVASGTASLPAGPVTASGAAILAPAVAAATAKKRIPASGAATLAPSSASGSANKRLPASGAAILAAASASGLAKVHHRANGAAILASMQASGSAKVVRKASGAAILATATGSGTASLSVANIILDQIRLEGRVLAIELEGRRIALQLVGQVNSET